MRSLLTVGVLTLGFAAGAAWAEKAPAAKPYKVLRTVKTGGEGGFDYIYADAAARRLYIDRSGPDARITVFNLDTLQPMGEIAKTGGHGVAVDPKTGHAFSTSKPVTMFDAKTQQVIKTVDTGGNPDGIFRDPFNNRVYILSHVTPNLTALNPKDGSIAGALDVGGAPEQSVSDGKGKIYVDVEDKNQIAVVDAKRFTVTARYGLEDKCGTPAGLAIDAKTNVLFVACRNPATMTMMNANTGKILDSVPIGQGVDGATFNPKTREAFSSQGDGTLNVVKELSPTKFMLEPTVQTPVAAKTITLDAKTGHLFLMTAEFGPAPAGAPAGPGGRPVRGPAIPGSFEIIEVGK